MVTSTEFFVKGVVNSWNDLLGDASLGEVYSVSSTRDTVVYADKG